MARAQNVPGLPSLGGPWRPAARASGAFLAWQTKLYSFDLKHPWKKLKKRSRDLLGLHLDPDSQEA